MESNWWILWYVVIYTMNEVTDGLTNNSRVTCLRYSHQIYHKCIDEIHVTNI